MFSDPTPQPHNENVDVPHIPGDDDKLLHLVDEQFGAESRETVRSGDELIQSETDRINGEQLKASEHFSDTEKDQRESDNHSVMALLRKARTYSTQRLVAENAMIGIPTLMIGGFFVNAVRAFAVGIQAQPPVIVFDPFLGSAGFAATLGCTMVWSTVAIPLAERLLGRPREDVQ